MTTCTPECTCAESCAELDAVVRRRVLLPRAARLDEALEMPARPLAQLCALGRVRVLLPGERVGRAILSGRPHLPAGALLLVLAEHADPASLPEDIPLQVLYDDAWLLMVAKPAPMPVCPDEYHPAGTLANALRGLGGPLSKQEGPARPGIVHRLDMGTSGVMVVARSDESHRALARQFAAHTVWRRYVALVLGEPTWDEQDVCSYLGKKRLGRKAFAAVAPERGKLSRTLLRVLRRCGGLSVIEALPATGRTHQIRVHLSGLGHPIVGDTLYGGVPARRAAEACGLRRPALHAAELGVCHPATGTQVMACCPPPADLLATGFLESDYKVGSLPHRSS